MYGQTDEVGLSAIKENGCHMDYSRMNETRGGLGDGSMTNKISYGHYNSHRKFCGIDEYPQTYHIIDDLYSSLRKVYGDWCPMAKIKTKNLS